MIIAALERSGAAIRGFDMTFYKCVRDELNIYKAGSYVHTFFKDELVTECEVKKIFGKAISKLGEKFFTCFEKLELSKNKVFWMFGARFACEGV